MPEIKDSENLLYLRNMGKTTTAHTADLVLDTIHQDMKKESRRRVTAPQRPRLLTYLKNILADDYPFYIKERQSSMTENFFSIQKTKHILYCLFNIWRFTNPIFYLFK
jgi:hypothetical protein